MKKKALITGVNGQDGSYLAELLLSKGYEVHGLCRPTSSLKWISKLPIQLHRAELSDGDALQEIVRKVTPDEIYNLGSVSVTLIGPEGPDPTTLSTALPTQRMLEAIRKYCPSCKLMQAGSSEMFGLAKSFPQNEQTLLQPRNPYGFAKAHAHWMGAYYRETFGMFVANGIFYNHESPRRGEAFVTRKIVKTVAQIVEGQASELRLGNLDALRDWGYAIDYVRAMWLMLQQPQGADYVIATGEIHSVRNFVSAAFEHVGLHYEKYVKVDERFVRPTETVLLVGDSTFARKVLDWQPSIGFDQLVALLVDAELEVLGVQNPLRKKKAA